MGRGQIAAGSVWLGFAVVLLCVTAPVDGSSSKSGPIYESDIHGEECPQYYLIGDLACGSSILFKYLKTELDIEGLSDQKKSLHVFDRLDAPRALASVKETPPVDGTPSMLRSMDAPLRLKAFCNFKEPPKFVVSVCDPAARTWSMYKHKARSEQQRHTYYHSGSSHITDALQGEMISKEYEACIKLTLPQLKQCMERMGSLRDCSHVLYGDSTPGSMEIDALGNRSPCNGVIFSSMYKALLDNWFSVFPQEDFLVLYGDDWIDFEQQPTVIRSVAKHFGVPLKQEDFSNFEVDPETVDLYWEKDETIAAPQDVQDELREFFRGHHGWQQYINVTGDQTRSNAFPLRGQQAGSY